MSGLFLDSRLRIWDPEVAPTSSPRTSSHHFPATPSSPPPIVPCASPMVSAKSFSWPAMKEPLCGSPVQVLMSMMSRAWLRRVRRAAS